MSSDCLYRIDSKAMLSLALFFTSAVLILSELRPAFALPTDNTALLARTTVPADTVDKYTVKVVHLARISCGNLLMSASVLPG